LGCKENDNLKPNYIGIVGGILAFISLVLPWWTMTMSSSLMGVAYSIDVSMYPYQARIGGMGISLPVTMDLWFGWVALALVVLGGLLGIVGSVKSDKARMMLVVGGVLALLSIVVFALGLQIELSKAPPVSGFPAVGLFSSGSYSYEEISMNYSTYLSFGFWLALVAAVVMFVASRRKPVEAVVPPPPPPPLATQ
jgi:hypothetical protein